jgi:integrase/recombinase XerD
MTTNEKLRRAFDLRGTPTNTRRTYAGCIAVFERFFGKPASKLGRKHVEDFLLHLVRERHVSPASHNVYAAALKFFYDAVLDRSQVMARVPRRKEPMRLPRLLSPTQIAQLLAAIPSIAVRTVLLLAYGAGLRVSEACELRVEDIDSRAMLLYIRHAKRGRERYVMLSPRLLCALREYWRRRRPRGEALFPGRDGKATMTRAAVARALRKTG